MELEEVGAIKMPKMITAKMVPIVNIKLEINMGVISPFTQEYIGLGVNAAAHMATPLEMTLTRKLTQIALDIKVPEEIKRYLSINEFVTGEKIEEVQILISSKYISYIGRIFVNNVGCQSYHFFKTYNRVKSYEKSQIFNL